LLICFLHKLITINFFDCSRIKQKYIITHNSVLKSVFIIKLQDISVEGNTSDASTQNMTPAQSQGWLSGWYSWYWQDPNSTAPTSTDGGAPVPPLTMSPPSTQGWCFWST
jgi:hypothetical protein